MYLNSQRLCTTETKIINLTLTKLSNGSNVANALNTGDYIKMKFPKTMN